MDTQKIITALHSAADALDELGQPAFSNQVFLIAQAVKVAAVKNDSSKKDSSNSGKKCLRCKKSDGSVKKHPKFDVNLCSDCSKVTKIINKDGTYIVPKISVERKASRNAVAYNGENDWVSDSLINEKGSETDFNSWSPEDQAEDNRQTLLENGFSEEDLDDMSAEDMMDAVNEVNRHHSGNEVNRHHSGLEF